MTFVLTEGTVCSTITVEYYQPADHELLCVDAFKGELSSVPTHGFSSNFAY